MQLFDAHCHLDFSPLFENLPEVLEEARALGVTRWFVPGCRQETWTDLRDLCLRPESSGVSFGVGQHPYFAGEIVDFDAFEERLRDAARILGATAIGECGLDKSRGGDPEHQFSLLSIHGKVASELGLPLVLHQVGLRERFLEFLGQFQLSLGGAVVHGFSGDLAWGKALAERGLLLGVGAGICRPERKRLREAVRVLPLERIMLETDAPDQTLPWRPGERRGRPADLIEVCRCVAELQGVAIERVAEVTTDSARRFYRLS